VAQNLSKLSKDDKFFSNDKFVSNSYICKSKIRNAVIVNNFLFKKYLGYVKATILIQIAAIAENVQ